MPSQADTQSRSIATNRRARHEYEILETIEAGLVLRGTEVDGPPIEEGKTPKLPAGDYPYAHPFYWSAFLLVGDSD